MSTLKAKQYTCVATGKTTPAAWCRKGGITEQTYSGGARIVCLQVDQARRLKELGQRVGWHVVKDRVERIWTAKG